MLMKIERKVGDQQDHQYLMHQYDLLPAHDPQKSSIWQIYQLEIMIGILGVLMIVFWFTGGQIRAMQQKDQQLNILLNQVSPHFYDFAKEIESNKQTISRISQSQQQYKCVEISPIFHYLKDQIMYFQTNYGIFIQGCQLVQNFQWSGTRENIKKWNANREVSEWALLRVQSGDHILYHRPGVYNLAEITMIRRIIGPKGSITIVDGQLVDICIGMTLNLYGVNSNIHYIKRISIKTLSNYTVIIANEDLFKQHNQHLQKTIKHSSKTLIYSLDGSALTNTFKIFEVLKFQLKQQPCGSGIFLQQLAGAGYFQLTIHSHLKIEPPVKESFPQGSLIRLLEDQYKKYRLSHILKLTEKQKIFQEMKKACVDLKSPRKYSSIVTTIYGRLLNEVGMKEVEEWEGQRQAVQWVRQKAKSGHIQSIYYEMIQSFNLLAIIEISALVQGTLKVVCSGQERSRVYKQIKLNKIKNVQVLSGSSSSQAFKSSLLITDNQILLQKCLHNQYLKQGAILGFFTHTRKESLEAVRKIYVHHELREVTMLQPTNQCIGFQYLHFFWNSQSPHGFYEITPSNYVIYAYWGGPASKLNTRKKLLVEQLTSVSVQVKILNIETFPYFQVKDYPIHPAYYLLTNIQKSDYIRVYLMHNYGGGYSDVKHIHHDWKPIFEQFEKDTDKLAYGYGELHDYDIPCYQENGPPPCDEVRKRYASTIGNGYYLFKKQSVVTKQWFDKMTRNLDNKLQALKQNPPKIPRQYFGLEYTLADGKRVKSQYPFRWAQIANEHLVRVQYKYRDKFAIVLPFIIVVDYRGDNLDEN